MHDVLITPGGRRIPGVIINGIHRPPVAGGSVTVSDETDNRGSGGMDIDLEDDTPSGDDDGGDGGEDDDTSPPDEDQYVSRADHERIKAALRNERRDRKRDKREFEEKISRLTSESTESSEVEVEKARIDERNKVNAYWTGEIVRARAMAEFAGWNRM